MDEQNMISVNLTSDDTHHVYPAFNSSKKSRAPIYILLIVLAGFLGFLATGLTSTINEETVLLIAVFLGTTVLFSVLFIWLSKKSYQKTITHIIVDVNGITFVQRNGQTVFYSMAQFINLRVTRHYYNGSYTGSSHSLLFTNAKGKQEEIQLGSMDKDLISTMFDDINCMKQTGHFFVPEISQAAINAPNAAPDRNTGTADTATASAPAVPNPNYPYGFSPVDGRSYRHAGDVAVEKCKKRNRIFAISLIFEVFMSAFSILVSSVTDSNGDFSLIFAILTAIFSGATVITALFFLILGLQGKQAAKNLIIQAGFYSNCLVIETTADKYVMNIPEISRIFAASPNRADPQGFRKIKVLGKDGHKTEINMGKLKSRKGYEVFGCYEQFFIDLHTWAANHGIICVNDISQ